MPHCDEDGDPSDESGQDDSGTADEALSVDATLDVLADAERRVILETLTESTDHAVVVDEIVNRIVRWRTEQTGELPSPGNIEIRLHHVHLPKLVEVDIVEYDATNGELRYRSDDRLERWLTRAQDEATD